MGPIGAPYLQTNPSLVGGLEHESDDFPYIGNSNPSWLSYFSEGEVNHQPEVGL